jgi:hypothetical protein
VVELQRVHPVIASGLASVEAAARIRPRGTLALTELEARTNWFNIGGLIRLLLTVPAADHGPPPDIRAVFRGRRRLDDPAFGLPLAPGADRDVLPIG